MSDEEKKIEETPVEPADVSAEEKAVETAEIPEVEATVEAKALPNADLRPGMLVRVHEKIKDVNAKGEEKERVQVFEGMIIGTKSAGISRSMTVRKNSKGWMVEKIFPLASPNIEKVDVLKQYRTRRAKLNHLRTRFKRKMREVEVK